MLTGLAEVPVIEPLFGVDVAARLTSPRLEGFHVQVTE